MDELLLVVAGGVIALVSSVTVTWLQGRHARRTEDRKAVRESNRELTRLFIAQRDAPAPTSEDSGASDLSEAELLATMITDRRTRDRTRDLIRLLREVRLPEMQELSGLTAERARQLLCGHALDVLGAHFRQERLPSVPDNIQRMLRVEDEALNIYTGVTPRDTGSTDEALGTRKVRRKPRATASRNRAESTDDDTTT